MGEELIKGDIVLKVKATGKMKIWLLLFNNLCLKICIAF